MSHSEMIGIVLDIYPYEENAHIVSFYTNSGILNLYALGLSKPKSKNRANLQIGLPVRIEYYKPRFEGKIGKLKKVHIVENFKFYDETVSQFKLKITKVLKQCEFRSLFVSKYLKILPEINPYNINYIYTHFLTQFITMFGIAPNFSSCRICNSYKAIVYFDLEEGGFICNIHEEQKWMDVNLLNLIWSSYNDVYTYINNVDELFNNDFQKKLKKVLVKNGVGV
ncbi:DNA repair protein RecO [Mycoplasmopsis gallinacea]|uniref:DNA repair protein RecO n=1 Tax=Mycoplasmopsis gallinacea TaxID=29556 RepID=A0A6H0V505_9BACT|nr:DNA repair protein RecO [Mycoplasmopsis gallinacea]QIW62107.1 DNA repair protein RecO [Mycoplasmopsis gallinacea]